MSSPPLLPPLRPPARLRTAGEALSGLELIRLGLRSRSLAGSVRGDGAPVVLVPGLGASDASMVPLRTFLRRLGHDAHSAGLGRISGDVEAQYLRLADVVAELHRSSGRTVALVGWSIGGVLSREVARDRPDIVRRLVTFGTPAVGGPSYSALAWRYSPEALSAVRARIAERRSVSISVPLTAIWSRRDGIVAPAACLDHDTPGAELIEVSSTHLGMGIDPDVWAVTQDRLQRAD